MINKRIIYAGLLASVMMGMIQMVYEGIWGAGFWSPVVFIAATVLRSLQNVSLPVVFSALPVILGLMGHMMNSVILSIIFELLIAPHVKGRAMLAISGMIYALVVFFFMWYVVVPAVDPVFLHLNGRVFSLAHLMWGLTLGIVLAKPEKQPA